MNIFITIKIQTREIITLFHGSGLLYDKINYGGFEKKSSMT